MCPNLEVRCSAHHVKSYRYEMMMMMMMMMMMIDD